MRYTFTNPPRFSKAHNHQRECNHASIKTRIELMVQTCLMCWCKR